MTDYNGSNYYGNADAYLAETAERRRLRRAAWAAAIPGIILFLVSTFLGVLAVFAGRFFGISYEKTIGFLSDTGVSQIIQIVLSVLLMTLPFLLCAIIAGKRVSDIAGLNKPEKGKFLPYLLLGVGFCSFANVAVSVAGAVLKNFGIDYSMPRQDYPEGFFGFMLVLISTAVVPAVVEEFAFRGILLGVLRPFGEVFCIFATSAVFGIIHGNFEQMGFAFMVGLILAFIRLKTESIAVCMAVHAINNAVSVIASYGMDKNPAAINIIYTIYIILALLCSVFGLSLMSAGSFKFPPIQSALGTKKTYVTFFFSPAIIIFAALFFFRALTYVFS